MSDNKAFMDSIWFKLILAVLSAVVGFFSGQGLSGCAQSVPVVVQNQRFECTNTVTNADGSIDYQGCKLDGAHPASIGNTDQKTDGKVDLPVTLDLKKPDETSSAWIRPADVRLN